MLNGTFLLNGNNACFIGMPLKRLYLKKKKADAFQKSDYRQIIFS
jgi:hypothetical protein